MPARLRPRPEVPESILTLASPPMWTDKRGIAHHFGVSTRQVDYWRAAGWFPFLKIKGVLRFDIAACQRSSDGLVPNSIWLPPMKPTAIGFSSPQASCNNFREFDEFIIGLEIETMFYSRTGEDAKAVRDELMSDRDGPERKKKYDRSQILAAMSRVVPLTHGQVMGEVCEEPGRGKKHATGTEYPDIQHPLGRSKRPEQNQGRTPRFKQMGYRLTKLVQLVQLRPPNAQIAPGLVQVFAQRF